MKKIYSIGFFIIALAACTNKDLHEQKIVNEIDYSHFLINNPTENTDKRESSAAFWENKLKEEPKGYVYMQKLAVDKAEEFEETGKVKYLHEADSLLVLANKYMADRQKVSNYLTLSSNAITQHEFIEAYKYAVEASGRTEEKFGPYLMIFDAAMEIGSFREAGDMLDKTKRDDSFDYLVRKSKFKDHLGDLDSAIILMEHAIESLGKQDERKIWATANLADMYGHAGKLKQAYNTYLSVLEKDPDYLHAIKGIAWLAFSHDANTKAATEIAHYLSSKTALPDMHLMLAEIATFEGNEQQKTAHLKAFEKEAANPKYKNMYNKYLAILYAEDFRDYEKAIEIAKNEVRNRPTPMVYALLAWVYEQKGEHQKALAIIEEHVSGKTFEPEAIYQMGMIYASNNEIAKAKDHLQEASEAWFELGPVKTKEINLKLEEI